MPRFSGPESSVSSSRTPTTLAALVVTLLVVASTGCATASRDVKVRPKEPLARATASPAGGTVLYRWVQLVSPSVADATASPDPQLLARAIVADDDGTAGCPDYSVDGGNPLPLVERQNNPDPSVFPILVCEIVVPASSRSLSIGGQSFGFLPLHDPLGQRVFVLGDTGCRGTSDNPCTGGTDTSMWGFPSVVTQIAGMDPTVVIHVGDYIYRQVLNAPGCDPSYDLCDSWTNWQADFFSPAAAILDRAPWVLSRGNHEECDADAPAGSGGEGWFFLLDPQTPCLTVGCAGAAPPTCASQTGHSAPYALDLDFAASSTSHTLRLLMVDSSAAQDNPASTGFHDDFQILQGLAAGADTAWMVTHRPLVGIRDASDASAIHTQDQELQQANRDYPLAGNVGHVISGHLHLFESIHPTLTATAPQTAHLPSQVVVGASGVNLVNAGASRVFQTVSGTARGEDVIAGTRLSGVLFQVHGFMTLEPASVTSATASKTYTWNGRLIDHQGDAKLACTLTARDGAGTARPSSRVACKQQ